MNTQRDALRFLSRSIFFCCVFSFSVRASSNPAPTNQSFSDANWMSIEGINAVLIRAAVVDGSGNLYIGGNFHTTGDGFATNIAKWNGNRWSALGSGISGGNLKPIGACYALAVSGSDLYVGGHFTRAGGTQAYHIAKWNGTNWSALGTGVSDSVYALAVSGSNLYAGGNFTTAGGMPARRIAKWDGSSWSALGSGIGGGFP